MPLSVCGVCVSLSLPSSLFRILFLFFFWGDWGRGRGGGWLGMREECLLLCQWFNLMPKEHMSLEINLGKYIG